MKRIVFKTFKPGRISYSYCHKCTVDRAAGRADHYCRCRAPHKQKLCASRCHRRSFCSRPGYKARSAYMSKPLKLLQNSPSRHGSTLKDSDEYCLQRIHQAPSQYTRPYSQEQEVSSSGRPPVATSTFIFTACPNSCTREVR